MSLKIALVANCPVSHKSMGGGDKTLIELAKAWQKLGADLTVFGPPESRSVCQVGGLTANFIETSNYEANFLGTKKAYLLRILKAVFDRQNYGRFDVIYSASEALPDVILSMKIRRSNPKSVWVVGFFLRARNPIFGEVSFSFSNFLQLAQQQLSLLLMSLFKVTGFFVAGRPDEIYMQKLGFKNIFRIGGGVDLDFVNSVPEQAKVYDACFVGRISSQKGVDDLLEIWRTVAGNKHGAKLAFIGWGHKGEAEIFQKNIETMGLSDNIKFFGFLEGLEKYKIVKSSVVSIFPSKYESFGIVLLESLACGVPVVVYDLPVLKDNFSNGVVYVGVGDKMDMAKKVMELINDVQMRSSLSLAGKMLARSFDWQAIAAASFQFIESLISR